MIASRTLTRVARADLCAGCGICAGLSEGGIEMVEAEDGFLRPRQLQSIPEEMERMISTLCPGLGQEVDARGRPSHPLWGPYLEVRTGWAVREDIRFEASSGGALSAILQYLLESGVVSGIVQIIADSDRPWANATTISRSVEEVVRAAGSRYAPSAPLANIDACLSGSEKLAFVGKPCDVAALRALAQIDARVDEVFCAMVSFFCAGVPSSRGAEEIVRALELESETVTEFRYRGRGWPGRATALTRDGEQRSMSYQESWGAILSGHVQHRCKLCADGTGKAADIVCADAWITDESGYPLFEERDGVSLIVARTPIGQELLRQAEAEGALATEPFGIDDLAKMQPGQVSRRTNLLARLAGFYVAGWNVPRYRGLGLSGAIRQGRMGALLRNFLGSVRRGLRRHLVVST